MSFLNEFKKFAMRGNVVDMAVGVVIGGAFGKIVSSLVADIIMPPIGKVLGDVNFTNLFVNLSDKHVATLAEAKKAGIPVIAYGHFINTVIDFLIIALVIFFMIKQINRLAPKKPAPPKRKCSYCLQPIDDKATRCPHCTSEL